MIISPTPSRRAHRRSVQRHLWSRRIRALLASGLVLGVGATITLAAWNDSEYATGSVTAGHFSVEGSADGSDFSLSEPEAPHSISFTPEADLFPGHRTYALFSVRTTAGSLAGTVQANALGGTNEVLDQYLTYSISTTETGQCDTVADFTSGSVVIERGTGLGDSPENSLPVEADGATIGSQIDYCLELTLAEDAGNDAQTQTTVPSWEFFATSTSAGD